MSLPDYMVAGRRERPTGISILSVLHVLGSILGVAVLVFFISRQNGPRLQQAFDAIRMPVPLFLFGIGFLSVLGLATGIAMWRGAKWGWYLGAFWYAYAIARDLSALFRIGDIISAFPAEQAANLRHDAGFYYAKFGIQIVVSALIYLYFFKENVREYFGLQNAKKWPAVAIHFAACIGIAVLSTIVATVGH